MDKVDQLFDRMDSLPPAPGLLPRLLTVLAREDTDLSEVTDMITVDPALTAKLLQTCNSAFLGRSTPVNDVTEAVHRLGFQSIYRLVAVVSGTQCLRPSRQTGIEPSLLWRHLVTTAFAAQFVAEDISADAGLLFTAALLHDIGKLILAEMFLGDYGPLIAGSQLSGRSLIQEEKSRYGIEHAEVGGRLLERWKFSPQMVAAVRFHHDSSAAGDEARLAACIELADSLAHGLVSDKEVQASSSPQLESALTLCGLGLDDLARYQDRIRENVTFVEGMCRL